MPTNLIEQVLKTIRNYDMLKSGDTVLAAVSGGPDSVFLLHALGQLKRKLGIKRIVVCNLDHGLRGKESADDSKFVKKLAAGQCFDFIHKRIRLKERLLRRPAKGGPPRNDDEYKDMSTEELAREERYEFFREAARSVRADCLATGHTLDDQAETILMRIVKGSALKGIVGISPVRKEGSVRVIRPLLEIEKKDIEEYLDRCGLPYRIDSSNIEMKYFRNVVRKEIMPFLEKYNPRLKRALFSLAEHLREDFEFIETARAQSQKHIKSSKRGQIEISLKDMVMQPRALQKEILRDSLAAVGGKVKKLSFRHWKDIESLIKHKRTGSRVDLPGSIRVTRTGKALVFSPLPDPVMK